MNHWNFKTFWNGYDVTSPHLLKSHDFANLICTLNHWFYVCKLDEAVLQKYQFSTFFKNDFMSSSGDRIHFFGKLSPFICRKQNSWQKHSKCLPGYFFNNSPSVQVTYDFFYFIKKQKQKKKHNTASLIPTVYLLEFFPLDLWVYNYILYYFVVCEQCALC